MTQYILHLEGRQLYSQEPDGKWKFRAYLDDDDVWNRVADAIPVDGNYKSFDKQPIPLEEALKDCHPEMPPPIAAHMGRHIGSFLRGLRRKK